MQQLRRSRISSTELITLRLTNPASLLESEPLPFLHSRSPVLCHSYRPYSFLSKTLVQWRAEGLGCPGPRRFLDARQKSFTINSLLCLQFIYKNSDRSEEH